eukprot:2000123-Amphidinium_carterae.1
MLQTREPITCNAEQIDTFPLIGSGEGSSSAPGTGRTHQWQCLTCVHECKWSREHLVSIAAALPLTGAIN